METIYTVWELNKDFYKQIKIDRDVEYKNQGGIYNDYKPQFECDERSKKHGN